MTEKKIITLTKNIQTGYYTAQEPMSYEMYLLYLLFIQTIDRSAQQSQTRYKNFCKNSQISCLVSAQLLLHKKNSYIQLFAVQDLVKADDLCLPEKAAVQIPIADFMNFIHAKMRFEKLQPDKLYLVIDENNTVHLVTNLENIQKKSFVQYLPRFLKTIMGL